MHKAKERERYPRAGDDEREYAQVRKADDALRRGSVAHILKTEEHGIREVSECAQDDDRSDRQGHGQATPSKEERDRGDVVAAQLAAAPRRIERPEDEKGEIEHAYL